MRRSADLAAVVVFSADVAAIRVSGGRLGPLRPLVPATILVFHRPEFVWKHTMATAATVRLSTRLRAAEGAAQRPQSDPPSADAQTYMVVGLRRSLASSLLHAP